MSYAKKIVLIAKSGDRALLDVLVRQFMRDGVKFIGVVGDECVEVEDAIDEIVVNCGNNSNGFILTSSHPGESVEDVVEFAHFLVIEGADDVQIVEC